MGDRAIIILHENMQKFSPAIYLHWHAPQVANYIQRCKEIIKERGADLNYATARLIGLIHMDIEPPLSLGVWNLPKDFEPSDKYLSKMSHGDGGVYLVDCDTWKVKTYGGYGLRQQNKKRDGGESDREYWQKKGV